MYRVVVKNRNKNWMREKRKLEERKEILKNDRYFFEFGFISNLWLFIYFMRGFIGIGLGILWKFWVLF